MISKTKTAFLMLGCTLSLGLYAYSLHSYAFFIGNYELRFRTGAIELNPIPHPSYRDIMAPNGKPRTLVDLAYPLRLAPRFTFNPLRFSVPLWPLPAMFILFTMWMVIKVVRLQDRMRRGACVFCGYLLVHRPAQCPECGRETWPLTTG